MRNISKVVCLMLVLMSLAVAATASENSIVTLLEPMTFHAERAIFQSAEIINPGDENQILKVVLPDSSILYRDLSTNQVWKEQKIDGRVSTSGALTEEELNLLYGLVLDTGWFPSNWEHFQFRFYLYLSDGRIVADLPGHVKLMYDEEEVQVGEELGTWLKWVGEDEGGILHMEAGVDIGYKFKIDISIPFLFWTLHIDRVFSIPKTPNFDFGFFNEEEFTPFLLGDTISCVDDILGKEYHLLDTIYDPLGTGTPDYPGFNLMRCYWMSEATATLIGKEICGNEDYCIFGEEFSTYFPVQVSNCQTNVEVTSRYEQSFHLNWHFKLRGFQSLEGLFPNDSQYYHFSEDTMIVTAYDGPLTLDFNEPTVQFQIDVPEPSQPLCVSPLDGATDQTQPVYLDWDDVSGVDYYRVQVDDNSNFSSPEIDALPSSSNYDASGLADGTTYYWRVRAHNSCEGWGDWNSGAWDFVTESPTDVAEINSPGLPQQFVLSQNYPNPFNMETRIQFALPQASHVTMDIYNVLGKRVRRLVDERLSAGWKVVTWDGCDDSGNSVSSGVFFYRMAAGDIAETKKMVLLK